MGIIILCSIMSAGGSFDIHMAPMGGSQTNQSFLGGLGKNTAHGVFTIERVYYGQKVYYIGKLVTLMLVRVCGHKTTGFIR